MTHPTTWAALLLAYLSAMTLATGLLDIRTQLTTLDRDVEQLTLEINR